MKIGSLFSGIGGLELGLERAGCGEVAWQCEADSFARRVLAKHWPGVPIFEDVRTMGVDAPIPPVDIICGGFPCQDISNAGRGEGLDGARSGLFFELARVVRLVRPRYIVLENVSAILARGGARVLGEVAACGYDGVWDCVPAAAVGAPHRRDRWFFVGWLGDTECQRSQRPRPERELGAFGGALQTRRPGPWESEPCVGGTADGLSSGVDGPRVMWPTPDVGMVSGGRTLPAGTSSTGRTPDGRKVQVGLSNAVLWPTPTKNDHKNAGYQGSAQGRWWPTLPGAAGSAKTPASTVRPVAPWEGSVPRTITPQRGDHRRDRLRALGNAVVPQVAEVVGRVLMEVHRDRV